MEILECKDTDAIVESANHWLANRIQKYQARRLFVPAGKTPESIYQKWESERPVWLKNLTFVQVDDVVTGRNRQMFAQFFNQQLPHYSRQLEFIQNSNWQGADLAMLGFGINGHVAFHEPEFKDLFDCACVRLADSTQKNLGLTPQDWGATYGVGAFLATKAVLLIVTGSAKQKSFDDYIKGKKTIATSKLKDHRDFTVLVNFN